MIIATLFTDVARQLFGGAATDSNAAVERELVDTAVQAMVDAIDPRLRLLPAYQRKIAPAAVCTIAHLRTIAKDLPAPIELTRSAWSSNPLVRALFANANDVPALFGRSTELRAFFEAAGNSSAAVAYAMLGIAKVERNVLAPAIVNGVLQHDVARTTVSFSGHRVIAPGADLAACRAEVGARILRRLAAIVLERIAASSNNTVVLGQRKAKLEAQLRLLNLRRNGIDVITDTPGLDSEITKLETELKTTVGEYADSKTSQAGLVALNHINAVFNAPAQHVNLTAIPLRLDSMGYKVAADSTDAANDLIFYELSIGSNTKIVMVFVKCSRMDIPPRESLTARAARGVF